MFFLFSQLLKFCDLLDTRHMSFNLHLLFLICLKHSCTICNLKFGGLAYYRPRPTRTTFVTLEYGGLAPARSVSYSKFLQYVTLLFVTIIDAMSQLIRKSSYVIVILWKVSRWPEGIWQHIPPNYFINGQQRKTTANSANLHYPPT